MLSSSQYSNVSPRLLVQSEPGFLNDQTLTHQAKNIMSILDLLQSGENIEASELMERTGYRPDTLVDVLIELCDRGYLLKDQTRKKLDH